MYVHAVLYEIYISNQHLFYYFIYLISNKDFKYQFVFPLKMVWFV